MHEPNRTQGRPPCPTATTPLAPRLGVFCGVLCCPVAGSFDRLTSTEPRTHSPTLATPSPRSPTAASEAAATTYSGSNRLEGGDSESCPRHGGLPLSSDIRSCLQIRRRPAFDSRFITLRGRNRMDCCTPHWVAAGFERGGQAQATTGVDGAGCCRAGGRKEVGQLAS